MAAGRYDGGAPRPVEEVLDDVDGLLDELVRVVGPEVLDGDHAGGLASAGSTAISRLVDASARLRVAGARIDALRWSVLPRIEAEGSWAQTGARTFAVWLARTQDVQTVTAKREVRTARALRDHLPATLTAALAGKVGVDKVRALVEVATTSTQRTQALGTPAVDLATIEPAAIEPAAIEPAAIEPAAIEPAAIEPAAIEPAAIEPAPEEPTGPTVGEPTADEPASGEPAADSTDAGAGDGPAPDGPAGAVDGAVGGSGSPTWEEQLLDWSTQNGPDQFRGLVRYFARHADPDADERGYTRTKDREYVDVSPTLGGYHLSGFLTEEHGQALTTAIGSVMGAPTPGDDRTPGQRRAGALADMTRVVLDNGHTGTGASVRPHLTVTVSWTELQALATKNPVKNDGLNTGPTSEAGTTGLAGTTSVTGHSATVGVPSVKRPAVFTETNNPVPTTLLRRIACDSEVTRIVFGPDSQVLDVGRAKRTITGGLRRAVIARDKHCVLGQCDQPPSRCEVHHAVRHWADGGETSVANAALLCWHHHDLVDTNGITMHYDNGWHFADRNGHPIHTTTPTS